MTWIKASHIMKLGMDVSRTRFNQPYYNNSRGTMTSNGIWTGNGTATNGDAFADLLLGLVDNLRIRRKPTKLHAPNALRVLSSTTIGR